MHCEFFYRVKRTSKINFLKPIFLGALLCFVLFIANGKTAVNRKSNFCVSLTKTGVTYLWHAASIKLGYEKNHLVLNIFGGLSYGKSKSIGFLIDYKIGNPESRFTPYISIQNYYSFEPVISTPALPYHYESVNSFSYGRQFGFYYSILPKFRCGLSSGLFYSHQRFMTATSVYFKRDVLAPGFLIEGAVILRSEEKRILNFPESDLGKAASKRNISIVFNVSPAFHSLGEFRVMQELRTEMDFKSNLFAGFSIVASGIAKKPFPTDFSRFGLSIGPGYRLHIGNYLALVFSGKLGYNTDIVYFGFQKIHSGYFIAGISERLRYYFPRCFIETGVEANQYLNFRNQSFIFNAVNIFCGVGIRLRKQMNFQIPE